MMLAAFSTPPLPSLDIKHVINTGILIKKMGWKYEKNDTLTITLPNDMIRIIVFKMEDNISKGLYM